MLVLGRKVGQTIICGECENRVSVTVLSIQGSKVRLGFESDAKVPIHRREVLAKIQAAHLRDTESSVQS
jgi:carbon storage regulator CsrA